MSWTKCLLHYSIKGDVLKKHFLWMDLMTFDSNSCSALTIQPQTIRYYKYNKSMRSRWGKHRGHMACRLWKLHGPPFVHGTLKKRRKKTMLTAQYELEICNFNRRQCLLSASKCESSILIGRSMATTEWYYTILHSLYHILHNALFQLRVLRYFKQKNKVCSRINSSSHIEHGKRYSASASHFAF